MITIAVTGHRPDPTKKYLDKYGREKGGCSKLPWFIGDDQVVPAEAVAQTANMLKTTAAQYGELKVVSGMALGIDMMWALAGIKAREEGAKIHVHLAIPYLSQPNIWDWTWKKEGEDKGEERKGPSPSHQLWSWIRKRADSEKVLFPNPKPKTDEAKKFLNARNDYMVEMADIVVAFWNGSRGGTGNCVQSARAAGKKILVIEPSRITCNYGYKYNEYGKFWLPEKTSAAPAASADTAAASAETAIKAITAYTDGSYTTKTKDVTGFGYVLVDGDNEVSCGCGCINDPELVAGRQVAGELKAAMEAILAAKADGYTSIVINSDYEGTAAFADGKWKCNKSYTQEYYDFVIEQRAHMEIKFQWIKGHSGNKWNDRADALANEGRLGNGISF